MPISRFVFVAALMVSLAVTSVSAADLTASVVAKMKETAALKGYRVNVKAKAGTVWLEGTVSDARQIDAAIAAAEEVAGVERVVNRLTVSGPAPANDTFAFPSSIRSIIGMPSPAALPGVDSIADANSLAEASDVSAEDDKIQPQSLAAEQAVLVDGNVTESVGEPPIALTQAVGSSRSPKQSGAGKQPPRQTQAGPRPFGSQAAKPVPQVRRTAAGVQRTAMKSQMQGQSLDLRPSVNANYFDGENAFVDGGFSAQGGVADGQMVPGSMRITEGSAGGYCPPGHGGVGGPMPMNAGMRGPAGLGGGGGMGGAGGMPVPVRGGGPNMPNYAWPSYAAYPNYAALQYPTQYSPTAWPYIGPFYPYPQVPLGWRRVSLEWDDGWWWLDFDERHIHSHHR